MDINYEIIYTFIIASSILAITPGPDNIFVLMQSVVNGKKYGLAVVGGLMSGCFVHTTLVAFGVSVLIQQSDTLFFIIKFLGASYLFFLAFKVFKSDAAIQLSGEKVERKSLGQLYRQGFIMNVLNPKVSIFFLAFFPGFLFSKIISNVTQFYVLGTLFVVVGIIVFGLIAILAGAISEYLKKNARVGIVLKWLQVTVFIGIGIFILFSKK